MSPDPSPAGAEEARSPTDTTSLHLRRAADGDVDSLSWIVSRFSPLLLAQAAYRMGPRLRQVRDPEDVVSEVWMVTLPRLSKLAPPSGRFTPVLLKFLSTVLLYRVNRLVRRCLQETRLSDMASAEGRVVAPSTSPADEVVAKVVRAEAHNVVLRCLQELDVDDQAVVILRSIEQRPGDEVARLLGVATATVYVRHHRALERLRQRVPGSLFSELEE